MRQAGRNIPWKPLALGGGAAVLAAVLGAVFAFGDSGVKMAHSDDPDERSKAVPQLVREDTPESREALRRLATDSNLGVARRAVRAIRHVPTLEKVFTDRQVRKEVRREAAVSLGKAKAEPRVLVGALDPRVEPDPEVRAGAAEGLSIRLDHSTIPQLFQALYDPDREVRLWAINAIHKMIARRYPYRAELPPSQQRDVIERIRKYLVWAKLM